MLNEFYRITFRKKVYRSISELQADLDAWIETYNVARPHQGHLVLRQDANANIPYAMPIAKEKIIAA